MDAGSEPSGELPTELPTRTSTGDSGAPSGEPDAPPLPSGTVIGAYRLVEHIGEGGMGRVYLAEHQRLGRRVALKILRRRYSEDKDTVHRFFEEARAVNRIQHAHIIEVTDFIEHDEHGSSYVMELLEGETLAERLKRTGPLSPVDVARLGAEVASALAAAHDKGIVHRDLKPANIYLTRKEERTDFVKLLDFGIAKLEGSDDQRAMGTPAYMAPEQLQGQLVDERADVYSLGVVLYEMLSGTRPFVGRSAGELLLKHATEAPPALPVKERHIPHELADLVMRCLSKSCDDRPAAAREVQEALLDIARPAEPPRVRPAYVVALVVTVVAAFAMGRSSSTPASPPPAPAALPAPTPALPTVVTVRFASTPPGAEVRREGGTDPLGVTPFELSLPRSDEKRAFEFSLAERGTLTTTASLAADGEVAVSFPVAPEPAPTTATDPPVRPRVEPPPKTKPPPPTAPNKPRDGRAVIIDPFAGG